MELNTNVNTYIGGYINDLPIYPSISSSSYILHLKVSNTHGHSYSLTGLTQQQPCTHT